MRTTSFLICLLVSALLSNASAQSPTNSVEAVRQGITDKVEVWYTVGNLSVDLLARAWGSPIVDLGRKSNRFQQLLPKAQINVLERGEIGLLGGRLPQLMNTQRYEEAGRTLDRMLAIVGQRGDLPKYDREAETARERRAFLERACAAGADGVEDYIGWGVVEPKPGQWDWSVYQENAREVRKAGLKYVPSVWVQNLPSWVRRSADYRFATCLEHGKASEFLSVFSPKTVEAYDRVFAQVKAALGPQIDALRIGSPCDYGETHYPGGAANQAFPVAHTHLGWWVGEPEARQHFLRWVEKKYGSVARMNAAWGTQFPGFEFDYPRDPASARRWLDFVEWYHEALIERLGVLFDVARKHFPKTPICVNLGWPFEKIVLGQDLSGLVKMLASKGMIVRTPTGPMVTHLYTRRVATAARFYHPARLSTEPMGSAPLVEIAGALFKDLTTGATWHFDYPENIERARELFQNARSLPRHDYPRIDAAVFFSTTAHRLENWDNWHVGFQGGYPEGMAPWLESLRDILDYDVVDERLIEDGALGTYRLLIWPFGMRVECRTMDKIRAWVAHGGTLLVRDLAAVRTVEGDRITTLAGKGRVVDAGGILERLAEAVRTRDRQMTGLPPLDARHDGVITSLFDDGILLFNRNAKESTVELPVPTGPWEVDYTGLPRRITLPPLAIRWLSGCNKAAGPILKTIGASAPAAAADNAEEMRKRLTEKVERVTQGVQKWAAGGHDPSAILKTMKEKVGPLLDSGKATEAEAELDRVLEQLQQDGKSSDSPTASTHATRARDARKPPATSEKPKYLIFWNSPEKAGELAERVGMKGDGKTRLLGFGLPIETYEFEAHLPSLIRSAFAAAREHDMAVMLHFDFHTRWKSRPDLWNWFDPDKPGYNPNNKYNVEWHGWDGPPSKARYLNWGVLERLPPNMCFTSKRIRAEITRIVSRVIGPVLREEIAKLKAEGKEALFVGVLVGSEPGIDDYSKPNPECAKMMKEDGVPAGPLGYRALLDRGFSADNPPHDFRKALAKIVQETIAFWCGQFVDAGIPAEKLYPHVAAPAPIEGMNAPIWTAFNKFSRPGWTTYAVGALGESFQPIYDELEKHGNPAWAGVEANAGVPGSAVDWETYLGWHYNHGCVLVGVNTGATGQDLPKRLWQSAFGKEAIAAYHKFLTGQPLVEKPISMNDRPQFRIQMKMKRVRDGIQRWHSSGKDPSAVGKLMQGAKPLANDGKLDELEKLVDHALEMLGETEKVPDVYRQE
ncbi:MAG: family 14 glycosylhydrolase [Thermoguttaceae bacterium]